MPTVRQRKIAKSIILNSALDVPLNGGELVEKSGYGKTMKLYPKRIIDTPGVKDALHELGFSEEGAKQVVQSILYDPNVDPSARLKASDQMFKVLGSYAPDKHVNINLNEKSLDPTNPKILEAMNVVQESLENE